MSTSSRVKCPDCKKTVSIPPLTAGQKARCPSCKTELPAVRPGRSRPALGASAAELPDAGTYVVTESPQLLFAGIRLFGFSGDSRQLPPQIVSVAGATSRWALPLDYFGDAKGAHERIRDLAGRLNTNVEFLSSRPGNTVPLSQALVSTWTLGDWLSSPSDGDGSASGLLSGDVGRRYILATRDGKHAREVFDRLASYFCRGIEVRPVHPSEAGGAAPYQHFWMVLGQPPLSSLRDAARVWRAAPAGFEASGDCLLYYEWPFDNSLPSDVLAQVRWGPPGSYVLLGPHEPRQVLIEVPSGASDFVSIAGLAELQLGGPVTPVRCEPDQAGSLSLQIQLRLVERVNPARALRDRIHDLSAEIRVKQTLLEELNQGLGELSGSGPAVRFGHAFEPLLVFVEPPDVVPRQLQRLLIELANQQELEEIYYQRISAACLGERFAEPGYMAHLLTTRRALYGDGATDLAVRLHDYRPQRSRLGTYFMLPEWEQLRLRIFIPRRSGVDRLQRLELYPDMRPTPESARRLAAAFGITAEQMDNRCVVLSDVNSVRLAAAVLPTRGGSGEGFRPLVDMAGWSCSLDVELATSGVPAAVGSNAAGQMTAGIGAELAAAARSLDPQLEVYRNRMTQVANRLAELEQRRNAIRQQMDRMVVMLGTIQTDIVQQQGAFRGLAQLYEAIRQVEGALQVVQNEYQQTNSDLQRILREIAAPWE